MPEHPDLTEDPAHRPRDRRTLLLLAAASAVLLAVIITLHLTGIIGT